SSRAARRSPGSRSPLHAAKSRRTSDCRSPRIDRASRRPSLLGMEWRERDGIRWLEADLPGALAAFSTGVGGVSEPPYDELNVAILTGDDREAVRENRRRLAGALARDPTGGVV